MDPVKRAKTTAAESNDAGLKSVEPFDMEACSEEDVSREVTFSNKHGLSGDGFHRDIRKASIPTNTYDKYQAHLCTHPYRCFE